MRMSTTNLEGLVKEAVRNENTLFNPTCLGGTQNPESQLENNIPRWIQLRMKNISSQMQD